jgi:hypothetical protein
VAAEVGVEPDGDACEIRFSDHRDVGGRQVPHRIDVHHAGAVYGQIEWTSIELSPAMKEQP